MKKCPFCAEEIQETAIKCKHCGEDPNKKIRFDCEVLDTDGECQKWWFEAHSQKEVEEHLLAQGWQLISICREGQAKKIVNAEFEKKREGAKIEARGYWILFIGALLIALFIWGNAPSSGTETQQKYCEQNYADNYKVCIKCVTKPRWDTPKGLTETQVIDMCVEAVKPGSTISTLTKQNLRRSEII